MFQVLAGLRIGKVVGKVGTLPRLLWLHMLVLLWERRAVLAPRLFSGP